MLAARRRGCLRQPILTASIPLCEDNPMKISIASYSFHGLLAEGKIDAFGYLESCNYRYGLNAADFWNGLIGTVEEDYLIKVRQAVEEREMSVVNYHVDG